MKNIKLIIPGTAIILLAGFVWHVLDKPQVVAQTVATATVKPLIKPFGFEVEREAGQIQTKFQFELTKASPRPYPTGHYRIPGEKEAAISVLVADLMQAKPLVEPDRITNRVVLFPAAMTSGPRKPF